MNDNYPVKTFEIAGISNLPPATATITINRGQTIDLNLVLFGACPDEYSKGTVNINNVDYKIINFCCAIAGVTPSTYINYPLTYFPFTLKNGKLTARKGLRWYTQWVRDVGNVGVITNYKREVSNTISFGVLLSMYNNPSNTIKETSYEATGVRTKVLIERKGYLLDVRIRI